MDAEDLLYLLYTSGTTARPKGIMHTTGGYLTQVGLHPQVRVRPESRHRRLLVLRRRRLGHRSLLHRLRPAREPGDERAVRGHARLPRQGPALGDRREVRRHDPLHRADRDPHVHEVGPAVRREARPVVAAAPRQRRRADQPGGLGLVLAAHRRWPVPGRRHLVADGDGRHHDQPAARRHDTQAGERHLPATGRRGRRRQRRRRVRRHPRRRLPRPDPTVAVDAARHLGRPASATGTRTGRASATSTSPATVPSATTTATSGSSAASTTSCSSPATTSPPPRSSTRSSAIPRSPKPRSSGAPTRHRARRSPRS